MNVKILLFLIFFAIGLPTLPQSYCDSVTVMADSVTGALQAPKKFFTQNLIPGSNITFGTNLVTGQVTINSTGAGGGSATNVYFFPSTFATWDLVGGSNRVTIVGLQPASDNLTNFSRLSTNAFDTSGAWKQATNANLAAWGQYGTNQFASTNEVQEIIDSQFIDIGPLAPASSLRLFGIDADSNAVPVTPRNHLSFTSDGSGGFYLDGDGQGGGGASILARTNVYARDTNVIIYDPLLFQTENIGLLTNSTLVITNPIGLTNWQYGHIGWHQDSNGVRSVQAILVDKGTLRTNQNAKGAITPTANAADFAQLELADRTGTNVLLSWFTNVSSYLDTNSLATGGDGGGGGGTFTFINSGSSAGTASTDNTLTLDTTGGNLIAACISYGGGSTPTITENKGNGTASQAIDTSIDPPSGNPKAVWYYWNVSPTVGPGHTFTVPAVIGATCNLKVFVFSRSGGNATYHTGTSEENNTGNWSSSGGVKPGSITPANANSLFLSTVIFDVAASSISNSASFTIPDSAISPGMQGGYKIKSSDSSAEDPNWTCSAGGGDAYATQIDFN